MNLYLICVSCLVFVHAIPASQRPVRDVPHLDLSYLPAQLPQLKEYLPPAEVKQSLANENLPFSVSKEYLTPDVSAKDLLVVTERPYDSTTTSDILETEEMVDILPPANLYLPPAVEIKDVAENLQLPTNEYLPPSRHPDEEISEILPEICTEAANHANLAEASGEVVERLNPMTQDTAIKDVDGYHYKIPDNIPDLFPRKVTKAEYLLPLANDFVEVEDPAIIYPM